METVETAAASEPMMETLEKMGDPVIHAVHAWYLFGEVRLGKEILLGQRRV